MGWRWRRFGAGEGRHGIGWRSGEMATLCGRLRIFEADSIMSDPVVEIRGDVRRVSWKVWLRLSVFLAVL